MRELPRGGRRTLVTTIALVIVSFVLMTFDLRASGEGVGGTLRNGAQAVFSPVQGLLGRAIAPVIDVVDGMANLAGLREENALLRAELQEMRTRVARVDELESQVALLQQAQDLELDREDITRVTANVLGGSDPLDLSFSIDRGTADGVLVGNPVIDPGGNVVGVVTDVFEGGARVLPLVAPTEAVGVTVGAQTGVVTGSGNPNRMELEILEATGPLGRWRRRRHREHDELPGWAHGGYGGERRQPGSRLSGHPGATAGRCHPSPRGDRPRLAPARRARGHRIDHRRRDLGDR